MEPKRSTTIDLILDLQPQTILYSTIEWLQQMEITYPMSLERTESTPTESRWRASKECLPRPTVQLIESAPCHWTPTPHAPESGVFTLHAQLCGNVVHILSAQSDRQISFDSPLGKRG